MDYPVKIQYSNKLDDTLIWPIEDVIGWDVINQEWAGINSAFVPCLKDTKVAVQAGGMAGLYPRLLKLLFDTVYTFEPDPYNFYCLVSNCKDPNIITIQAALSNRAHYIRTNTPAKINMGRTFVSGGGNIPALELDSFKLPACDLLMLDVETQELEVLGGAIETISKYNPVIVAEANSTTEQENTKDFLRWLGYKLEKTMYNNFIFTPPH